MGEHSVAISTPASGVLLVDEQDSVLTSLAELLSEEPYHLYLAHGSSQALELMAQHPIDLVMSAAHLAQMDGASLLARIHQDYPQTIRILLTGDPDLALIVKAINEGQIYRYLSKPWNDQEMLLTLRQALAHQHSERERQRLETLAQTRNGELRALNSQLVTARSRAAELVKTLTLEVEAARERSSDAHGQAWQLKGQIAKLENDIGSFRRRTSNIRQDSLETPEERVRFAQELFGHIHPKE